MVRLAFAVAIHVDPEILLVDEALAVGDIYFRQRCMRKVHELRSRGITILFVSHAIGDVKAIGDRALWLEQGRIREIGDTDRVVAKYLAAMVEKDSAYLRTSCRSGRARAAASAAVAAPGDRRDAFRTSITGTATGGPRSSALRSSMRSGQPLHLLEPLVAHRGSDQRAGQGGDSRCRSSASCCATIWGSISPAPTPRAWGIELPPMLPGDIYTVDFHAELPELYPGSFSFSPAIADGTLDELPDVRLDRQRRRRCKWGTATGRIYGYMHLPCRVEVNSRLLCDTTKLTETSLG